MVKRTNNHIIDTLAVRNIMSILPENWLIRGLDERDYGIDLKIELFDGENPTGVFSLIQVKGKEKGFRKTNGEIKLHSFPTKTMKYSLLFPETFFVFHVSNKTKKVYFVWLQKYIQQNLEINKPNWFEQKTNTICFPQENELNKKSIERVEKNMYSFALRMQELKFLKHFETLKFNMMPDTVYCNKTIKYLLSHVNNITKLDKFWNAYNHIANKNLLLELHHNIENLQYDINDSLNSIHITLDKLECLKHTFLNLEETEIFQYEMTGQSAY